MSTKKIQILGSLGSSEGSIDIDLEGANEGEINPINADTLNGQLPEYYAKTSDLDSYAKVEDVGLKMDLLWENASPTSEFAAQTVSLDLTGYQYIYIEFYLHNDTTSSTPPLIPLMTRNTNISPFRCASPGFKTRARNYIINTDNIDFKNGEIYNSYASSQSTDNTVMIPYQIYGIK